MTLITAEIIKQQDALKDLPENQVKTFEKLANNLFKKEMDNSTGVWHRRLEEDVKTLYGIDEKPQGMKSYEFLKHAKAEFDKKIEKEKTEIGAKGGDISEIEKKYKDQIEKLQNDLKNAATAGNELLKRDLDEYKKRLDDKESLIEDLKKKTAAERMKWDETVKAKERDNLVLEVGFERAQALQGVEFDPLTPQEIRKDFLESKWSQILSKYTPEKVDGKTQWRDKDGKLVYNEQDGHELADTKYLYMKAIGPILKQGRQQAGAGTGGGGGGGGGANLDLRGAKTQVSADEAISQYLLSQGKDRFSDDYRTEFSKIREESKVAELPLQ